MAEPIVRVEGLIKDFRPGFGLRRRRVLHGIRFHVQRGEIFGFVGPNGAGKTTTLKILMGLVRPSSGSASILGHDVRETGFRHRVGFLPESPYFYEFLSGRELLRFYARVAGVPRRACEQRVAELLERVGLADAAGARLRTYSKGMLQRIGIAQALVHDPEVIFLDEPMSGLDPIGRKEIRDLILRMRAEGRTVFMNTHILHDVETVCDRLAILVQGRIRYEGRVADFLQGDERQADVLLAGVSPRLAERLQQRGLGLRGVGGRIEVRVSEKHVGEVLRLALDEGAEVASVTPHRTSLESVFLSAVRESSGSREEAS